MSRLETEIRRKLQDAAETVLGGSAADHVTYVRYVTRYHVLKELVDFVDDLRKDAEPGDDPTDD
jgi:hypothetical protein